MMPVVFFDYVTHFEGQKMLSTLTAFDPSGGAQVYEEIWDLKTADSYHWSLKQQTAGETIPVMEAVYTRETD